VKVRFRNQAFADLLGIHRWIAREDTPAADEVIVRILAGVERLGVFPGIGRRGEKAPRSGVVG